MPPSGNSTFSGWVITPSSLTRGGPIVEAGFFRDNRGVAVAPRACALICVAAGLAVCRPAAAAMTIVFRDGRGQKRTYSQEGNRVRIVNPTGKDDGEACIIDLNSSDHRV